MALRFKSQIARSLRFKKQMTLRSISQITRSQRLRSQERFALKNQL
jgi:hypothetical protein